MESLPFLSKARLEAENALINNATNPEEIMPLVNRWLMEYRGLTSEEINQLSLIAQEALRTQYMIAQRIASICEERKRLQEIRDSSTSSQKSNTGSTENIGSVSSTTANPTPATVASPNPANQPITSRSCYTTPIRWSNENINTVRTTSSAENIGSVSSTTANPTPATVASPNTANQLDDQPSTSRSCYTTPTRPSNGNMKTARRITSEHAYCADPRKRVLREMYREANLSGTSTSTTMQCADNAASSSRASIITSTENFHNRIVGSNNIRNVVNDREESPTTSSNNATESVAAYETVGTSTETAARTNTNSAVSEGAVSMSTPTPALSPPMASSTPIPMPSPFNDENAVHSTVIGPNGTKVPTERFNAISFTAGSAVTRSLLCMIFPEDVLATHTLSGKPSPAFVGRERQPKGQLDPEKIADIIHCVTSRTSCSEKEVRMTITTKCADSTKKLRRLSITARCSD